MYAKPSSLLDSQALHVLVADCGFWVVGSKDRSARTASGNCNGFPPKRVQQGLSHIFGIETLAGGAQATTELHDSQLQPKICILLQYA